MAEKRRRKVWAQHVVVSARMLETRLAVADAQGLGPDQRAAAAGAQLLLDKARDAANGVDPKPGLLSDWWSGALIEAAYQNLHGAKVEMVDVYDDADLVAEIPEAAARAHQTLQRDDPRRQAADRLGSRPPAMQRAYLRRVLQDCYDAMDRQHERLRSFRNIVLVLAMFIVVLVAITMLAVWGKPSILPLCFPANGGDPTSKLLNCPTAKNVATESAGDIFVVGLFGLLGGALAAAMSIRNLRGTSSPYDVPVALACLKVPLGAFTAILGLIAIQGQFIPGLSALDSQQQILAYALLLGYGQQVFTHSLDVRAQSLLEALPGKDVHSPPSATATAFASAPEPVHRPPHPAGVAPTSGAAAVPTQYAATNGTGPSTAQTPPAAPVIIELPSDAEPDYQPPPLDLTDDSDVADGVQDDDSVPMPNVSAGDHR
jgi:hypothetical protein